MQKDSILLLTKDALCTEYLPCYGNTYWKGQTPNIDELVKKGTLFTSFYTGAPSSAMAYLSMFTGKYPYEQPMRTYVPLVNNYEGETLFDKALKLGYESHIIWDEKWMTTSYLHSKCFGESTIIHALKNLRQPVGAHYVHAGKLKENDEKLENTLMMLKTEILEICNRDNKVFLWLHLPHVINGRVSYASDIDVFDRILGMLRGFFDDNNIFVSADHGNMNGHLGKVGYGFDVYEPAARIPLITPRIGNKERCTDLVSNVSFFDIIFKRTVPQNEFIYSDTAYYAQPNRKLMIAWNNYRYIYNKINHSEELYDIEWDPSQNFNLIADNIYDVDRYVTTPAREYYFYPKWNNLDVVREIFRTDRKRIWKEADRITEIKGYLKFLIKPAFRKFKRKFLKK